MREKKRGKGNDKKEREGGRIEKRKKGRENNPLLL